MTICSYLSTKEVYNAMSAMRAHGHSNAKIAKACGCTQKYVLDMIGYQPRSITQASHRKAYARRTAHIVVE